MCPVATLVRPFAFMLIWVSAAYSQPLPPVVHSPIVHPWLDAQSTAQALEIRILPPAGYRRMEVTEGSFARWLRRLPLKKDCPPVLLFNGQKKACAWAVGCSAQPAPSRPIAGVRSTWGARLR